MAAISEALAFVHKARSERAKRRDGSPQHQAPRTKPVLLPTGTPLDRLKQVRIDAVCRTARRALRHGGAGGSSFRVWFAASASEVNYRVVVDYNRTTYGGAYKGWKATEDHHRICVPPDWRVRVERRGLAIVDGLMTLDAHELEPDGDIQVFAATWARQGPGYAVAVDRGYIARLDSVTYHAASAAGAVRGVRRKNRIETGEAPAPRGPYTLTVDAFIQRYARHSIEVTLDDARATGSCEYGIRSWCAAVGLDYDLGFAPLAAVLEGFRRMPMIEVRRAVVRAVRQYSLARRRSVG